MKTFFGSHIPPENSQHLLQRLSKEANSDITIPGLCSTYGKANNQAFYKAKTKITGKKTRYKVRQIREQRRYLSWFGFQ